MGIPDWITPPTVLTTLGMAFTAALWVDNWVHKRTADTTKITNDLERISERVKAEEACTQRIEATLTVIKERLDRLQANFDSAESVRVERAQRVRGDFKRLEATVAQHHTKAMTRCDENDKTLDLWTDLLNKVDKRVVAIETLINQVNRSLRVVKEDDPPIGPHS